MIAGMTTLIRLWPGTSIARSLDSFTGTGNSFGGDVVHVSLRRHRREVVPPQFRRRILTSLHSLFDPSLPILAAAPHAWLISDSADASRRQLQYQPRGTRHSCRTRGRGQRSVL